MQFSIAAILGIAVTAGPANATFVGFDYTATIVEVPDIVDGATPRPNTLGLFDTYTDLNSADIVIGRELSGQVKWDPTRAGGDLSGAGAYQFNPTTNTPVSQTDRFLFQTVDVNGNGFSPGMLPSRISRPDDRSVSDLC